MVTKVSTITLPELIQKFLASRKNLAPSTQDFYRNILGKFLWYLRNQGWPTDPNLITRDHLRGFVDYVATEEHRWPEGRHSWYKKAAPATAHHYGRGVKTFFSWAEEEEYLDHNPSLRLRLGSPHYKDVLPYSDDEVYAMLSLCEDDARLRYRTLGLRNKAVISLFVATGLRVAELTNIKLPWVGNTVLLNRKHRLSSWLQNKIHAVFPCS